MSSDRPPPTYVVLLRGINVGGKHRLPMAELRAVCAEAGCTDVTTYIQSGNVVLRSDAEEAALVADLEWRLRARTGSQIPVVVRTEGELADVVARCPFDPTVDPARLMVAFAPDGGGAQPLGGLDVSGFAPEDAVLDGRHLYLWFPEGQGRSRLSQAVSRTPFGKASTVRNWKTILALQALAAETG